MALGKDRTRFSVVGLDNLEVRRVTTPADSEFACIGYLDGTTLKDAYTMVKVPSESGNLAAVLPQDRTVSVETRALQTSVEETALVTGSKNIEYAIRYSGLAAPDRFQYFALDSNVIDPSLVLAYQAGKRTLPFMAWAVEQQLGYEVPPYYMIESRREIRLAGLRLWLSPRSGDLYGYGTAYVLDSSGWARHGTLYGYAATSDIQKLGTPNYLRFDGANDYLSHGNIFNMGSTEDFILEAWIRIQAANGSTQRLLGKKDTGAGTNAGYILFRHTDNTLRLGVADGVDSATALSVATATQNVWKHVAVVVDRGEATAQMVVNGAASGDPADLTDIGNMDNAVNFMLGRSAAAEYSQVDIGDVRVYTFGNDGMIADPVAMLARHFAGEQSYYGV